MIIAWYMLINHLVEHLKSINELDTVFNIGMAEIPDDVDKPSKIEVDWDCESDIQRSMPRGGNVVLYIDISYRNDDPTATPAFKAQYEVQRIILKSLDDWHDKILRNLDIATIIKVHGIASYGKIMRPNYNNRIVLEITWKDSGRRR